MDLTAWLRRPRLVAALACFLLGTLVLGVTIVGRLMPLATTPSVDDPAALEELPLQEELGTDALGGDAPQELIVYVTGAVWRPDVYRLPPTARVKDAVVAAGGLRPDAADGRVNLAEPLTDAQHIHIPLANEDVQEVASSGPAATGLLDLNRATAADLEELPGVGKTIAERIIARRTEQGPYKTVDELREVPGVGAKLFAQLAPLVTVGR